MPCSSAVAWPTAGAADVLVNGGAEIARQYLEAGALEGIRLHLVPTILGAGTRLFDGVTPPNVRLRPTAATGGLLATRVTDELHPAGDAGEGSTAGELLETTTGGTEPGDRPVSAWCRMRDESSPHADRVAEMVFFIACFGRRMS